jgi:catecholate siderophore receptor
MGSAGRQGFVTASLFKLERTNIKSDPTSNTWCLWVCSVPMDWACCEIAPSWQVWAGYAFLDGEMTTSPAVDAGQPVQGKRPMTGKAPTFG